MEITFSILGLVLLLLIIFVFRELIADIIAILLIVLLITWKWDDFKNVIQETASRVEIKIDTTSNNKIIDIK